MKLPNNSNETKGPIEAFSKTGLFILFCLSLCALHCSLSNLTENVDKLKAIKAENAILRQDLNECSNKFVIIAKQVDSLSKATETHTQRVIQHLHAEKRYRKGQIKIYKNEKRAKAKRVQ